MWNKLIRKRGKGLQVIREGFAAGWGLVLDLVREGVWQGYLKLGKRVRIKVQSRGGAQWVQVTVWEAWTLGQHLFFSFFHCSNYLFIYLRTYSRPDSFFFFKLNEFITFVVVQWASQSSFIGFPSHNPSLCPPPIIAHILEWVPPRFTEARLHSCCSTWEVLLKVSMSPSLPVARYLCLNL